MCSFVARPPLPLSINSTTRERSLMKILSARAEATSRETRERLLAETRSDGAVIRSDQRIRWVNIRPVIIKWELPAAPTLMRCRVLSRDDPAR